MAVAPLPVAAASHAVLRLEQLFPRRLVDEAVEVRQQRVQHLVRLLLSLLHLSLRPQSDTWASAQEAQQGCELKSFVWASTECAACFQDGP